MVNRHFLSLVLFVSLSHNCNAEIGRSAATNQAQAIEQGNAALNDGYLNQLKDHTSMMERGNQALDDGYLNNLVDQYREQVVSASEEYTSTEAMAKVKAKANAITYKILITDAMNEGQLKLIFGQLAHRSDVTFVIRGLLDTEKTINDVSARLVRLLRDFETIPRVVLDPRPFKDVHAEVAPQVLMYKGEMLISSASGLSNPDYLYEEFEKGNSGDLGNFGDVVKISETDITEILKERMAKLDKKKLIADAKERFWDNIQFYGLPKATKTVVREFAPVLTVQEDITTPDGQVIAYAGQVFNTLEQMPFTQRLVIFDATSPAQVTFVKHLPKSNLRTQYITTRYDRTLKWDAVKSIESELNAPVYQLKPEIIQAFNINVIPSVITADNNKNVFIIKEILVSSSEVSR